MYSLASWADTGTARSNRDKVTVNMQTPRTPRRSGAMAST